MSSNTKKVVLFICPICCGENPGGKIYQCKNGHSVCAGCSFRLQRCPECRVPLGEDSRIRNRALEAIMGDLEAPCTYKEHGCTVEMARKELSAHLSTCRFRPTGICKLLGYSGCGFVSSSANELFQHVTQQHGGGTIRPGTSGQPQKMVSRIDNLLSAMRTIASDAERIVWSGGREVDLICKILRIHVVDKKQGYLSIFCIHFAEEEVEDVDCLFEMSIKITASTQNMCLSWTVQPLHYKMLEESLKNPPKKIPIPFFLENFDEPEARVHWEFTRKNIHSDLFILFSLIFIGGVFLILTGKQLV